MTKEKWAKGTLIRRLIQTCESSSQRNTILTNMSFSRAKINNLNLMSCKSKLFLRRTISLTRNRFLIRWLSWSIWMRHSILEGQRLIILKCWMLIRTIGFKWCWKILSCKSFTAILTSNFRLLSRKKSITTKTTSTYLCFTRVQRKETSVIFTLLNACRFLQKKTERREWSTTRLIKLIKSTITTKKKRNW